MQHIFVSVAKEDLVKIVTYFLNDDEVNENCVRELVLWLMLSNDYHREFNLIYTCTYIYIHS